MNAQDYILLYLTTLIFAEYKVPVFFPSFANYSQKEEMRGKGSI